MRMVRESQFTDLQLVPSKILTAMELPKCKLHLRRLSDSTHCIFNPAARTPPQTGGPRGSHAKPASQRPSFPIYVQDAEILGLSQSRTMEPHDGNLTRVSC
jgi:hypothetical protein